MNGIQAKEGIPLTFKTKKYDFIRINEQITTLNGAVIEYECFDCGNKEFLFIESEQETVKMTVFKWGKPDEDSCKHGN